VLDVSEREVPAGVSGSDGTEFSLWATVTVAGNGAIKETKPASNSPSRPPKNNPVKIPRNIALALSRPLYRFFIGISSSFCAPSHPGPLTLSAKPVHL
jgi:hypothetical protein